MQAYVCTEGSDVHATPVNNGIVYLMWYMYYVTQAYNMWNMHACMCLTMELWMPCNHGIVVESKSLGMCVHALERWTCRQHLFPALSPFQRSTDSNGKIRSLIRPWLIGLRTWLIGVPTIRLQAVILLKIYCTINNPTQLLSQTINISYIPWAHAWL